MYTKELEARAANLIGFALYALQPEKGSDPQADQQYLPCEGIIHIRTKYARDQFCIITAMA
jgi:hypothetical protein